MSVHKAVHAVTVTKSHLYFEIIISIKAVVFRKYILNVLLYCKKKEAK